MSVSSTEETAIDRDADGWVSPLRVRQSPFATFGSIPMEDAASATSGLKPGRPRCIYAMSIPAAVAASRRAAFLPRTLRALLRRCAW